jgi:hypothetical protein
VTRVTLGSNFSDLYPHPSTPYPYGYGCGVNPKIERFYYDPQFYNCGFLTIYNTYKKCYKSKVNYNTMIIEVALCPRCAAVLAFGHSAWGRTTRWSLCAGDTRCAGHSARATHDVLVARRRQCTTRWSLGVGDARRAGRRSVVVAAAPWKLCAFFVPTAMCSRSVGAGDAQRAGRRGVVVAAAPWKLRVFFVPAAMCSCSVTGRG